MVTNLSNISNINRNVVRQNNESKAQPDSGAIPMPIPMTTPANNSAKIDTSNDGKFSFFEAAKNFAKGLVSPITSMFESKKNFFTGAAMIIGSAVLVVATGGAATPFLLAAGVAMGAVQGGQAVYKIAKAKDGDDVEKAFYDIGGATGAIGLSVAGAKGSLKSAGLESEGLNAFSATVKCFTSAKAQVVESFNVFKNGYFKTNLSNFIKPFSQPRVFKDYSKTFAEEGIMKFNEAFKETLDVLPENLKPLLKGRPKSKGSIYSKIVDECIVKEEKIEKIMKSVKLSEAQKTAEIANLKNKEAKYLTNIDAARGKVNDLIGTRIVLKDAGKAAMNELAASLIEGIKNDKIVITEVRNYRGTASKFYFSKSQIEQIQSAAAEKGIKITVLEGEKQIKSSGYTAVQMKIQHANGALGELQIRGKVVDKVADFEHIPYDLKTGKDISRGSNKIGELLAPFEKTIKKLTETEYVEYEKYLAKTYKAARKQELGLPTKKVELPKQFDGMLSTENLHKLHEKTSRLPSKETSPIAILPQTAVSYNFLKLTSSDKK